MTLEEELNQKDRPNKKILGYNNEDDNEIRPYPEKPEYILCAAIKRKEPKEGHGMYNGNNDIFNIEIGYRHGDIIRRFNGKENLELSPGNLNQGFYTSLGRYVDRYEAMKIARFAGQIDDRITSRDSNILFSEDLY